MQKQRRCAFECHPPRISRGENAALSLLPVPAGHESHPLCARDGLMRTSAQRQKRSCKWPSAEKSGRWVSINQKGTGRPVERPVPFWQSCRGEKALMAMLWRGRLRYSVSAARALFRPKAWQKLYGTGGVLRPYWLSASEHSTACRQRPYTAYNGKNKDGHALPCSLFSL